MGPLKDPAFKGCTHICLPRNQMGRFRAFALFPGCITVLPQANTTNFVVIFEYILDGEEERGGGTGSWSLLCPMEVWKVGGGVD